MLVFFVICLGLVAGSSILPNLALVVELSGEDAGTGTGLANTIWQTAGIISPVTFAWLLESTGAYRMSWQMLASTVLLAALFYKQVRERMSKI